LLDDQANHPGISQRRNDHTHIVWMVAVFDGYVLDAKAV
jgi:hypothetical protein